MTLTTTSGSDLETSTTTVLCVSDSDTRLKWTQTTARALADSLGADTPISITLVSLADGAVPSERQLTENAVTTAHLVVDEDGLDDLLDVEILVVNTVGSRLARLLSLVTDRQQRTGRRPIVVTGYAGLVYEKHVEGLVWRLGADVVCCNSALDREQFGVIAEHLGADPSCLVRTGASVVTAAAKVERDRPAWPPHTVVFAVQPDVPRHRSDRLYLLERLVGYARAFPDRDVIVKLRSHPDEATTHRERHHYGELYERSVVDRPPNLRIEYGHMSTYLAVADLLLTVSSTAALEAAAMGVPAGVLTDVGLGESLGNHAFIGSGLLVSMNDVDADVRPDLDPGWAATNGLDDDDDPANLAVRVRQLLEQRSEGSLPLPSPYVAERTTPRLHARSIAPTDASGESDRRVSRGKTLLRSVLRGPARRWYRRVDRWARS